ncbi:hypothetical protein [Ectobacillus panaciterrae]|uniref:hypothetical protein n=1 Tax=Ectobacillus panaciterrae TaxID=363872 RepID=UPI0004026308|nr:hypothetical protein [Ectobacillus panaciterrae]
MDKESTQVKMIRDKRTRDGMTRINKLVSREVYQDGSVNELILSLDYVSLYTVPNLAQKCVNFTYKSSQNDWDLDRDSYELARTVEGNDKVLRSLEEYARVCYLLWFVRKGGREIVRKTTGMLERADRAQRLYNKY